MRHHGEAFQVCVWLALAASAVGCSAEGDPPAPRRAGFAGASAGASGVGASTPWTIGVENASDPLAISRPDASVASADDASTDDAAPPEVPVTAENSCGKGKAGAKLEPVNMFVMIDRSGSMNDDNKWIDATAALMTFFRDPKAGGIRVALRFFPAEVPVLGCSDVTCDANACSQPLVAAGELTALYGAEDPQERALVLAVAASNPGDDQEGGGTPIHPALDGALRWSTGYKSMHPYEKTVVVFATDGEPNGCNENFSDISALAAAALQSSGVNTYAIGFEGSNPDQINQLALAGGTKQGIFVDPGPTAEQQLVMALNAIRGETLSCDFVMPAPSDLSMKLDPKRVNVTFTPSLGSPGTFSQVPDQSACGARKSWYYDVPASPSRVFLCPAACDLVRADPKAALEVLLGCATACGGIDMSCGGEPPPPEVPPVLF